MKLFSALFCIIFIVFSVSGDIKVYLSSETIYAGKQANLIMQSSDGMPNFVKKPSVKGLQWLGESSSTSMQIINFKSSSTYTKKLSFTIDKPGKYVIPSAEAKAGGKIYKTDKIEFEVKKLDALDIPEQNGNQVKLNNLIFSDIKIAGKNKEYYYGEEIPVEIRVFCATDIRIQLSYPEISLSSGITPQFRKYPANREAPNFDAVQTQNILHNGRYFRVYVFRTAFRVFSSGEMQLLSKTRTSVTIVDNRHSDGFFDDFFSEFNARKVTYSADAKPLKLKINPLPPVPEKSHFLQLTGNWKISCSLSSQNATAGNAITVTLSLKGHGSAENIKAPELQFDSFRVYKPEIIKGAGDDLEIKYTLIPLNPGKKKINFSVCSFNSDTGKYDISNFENTLNVKQETAVLKNAEPEKTVNAEIPAAAVQEQKKSAVQLKYLKNINKAQILELPLWKNKIIFCISIIIAGILLVAVTEILSRNSGKAEKQRKLKNARAKILRLLKNCNSEQQISEVLSEYLNMYYELPPGASFTDAADKAETSVPELSKALKDISNTQWSGGKCYSDTMRKTLAKYLKRLMTILILLTSVPLFSQQDEGRKLYDNGKFQEAMLLFQKIENFENSPEILYNIGNCCYNFGNFSLAAAYYESAWRLSPRDSDIISNLNLALEKLKLPPRHKSETPADIFICLRDLFRIDELMLIASICIVALLLCFVLRKKQQIKKIILFFSVIAAVILILSAVAGITQFAVYGLRESAALTVDCKPRTLPSLNAPEAEIQIKPGEIIYIQEDRDGWVRTSHGVWIQKKNIKIIASGF